MRRLLVGLILLLLFSTYNLQGYFNINSKLNLKKILIENNNIVDEKIIKKKLSFLYNSNLFYLDSKKIKNQLMEIKFIESFRIKKIFPNTIRIKIFEKKPIAILHYRKNKKYITDKGDLIDFVFINQFRNLPTVFGDKKSFKIFYIDLQRIDFPINEIKTFYLFESKRWDLLTFNEKLIKLPVKNYEKSLENFLNIKDQENFEKYKIFDYRISNQLILK